jgi:branched-chain amino acid transport system permease protein
VLAQQLTNGVVLGAVYCLFAMGFNLIFGVVHVINLLYGVYFALGAYLALLFQTRFGMPLLAVLLLAAGATGVTAALVDTVLLVRLRGRDGRYLSSLIITMGAAAFFYSLLSLVVGVEPLRFPVEAFIATTFRLGLVRISGAQILILALTPALAGALFVWLRLSRRGVAVRAAADNERAALLMGIDPARMTLMVSFLAGSLAGFAGILTGLNLGAIQPYMGETMMLRGFTIVILGGLGSLAGAAVAGLGLGVAEILIAGYGSSLYREVATFALLLLTLWLFPSGLSRQASGKRI